MSLNELKALLNFEIIQLGKRDGLNVFKITVLVRFRQFVKQDARWKKIVPEVVHVEHGLQCPEFEFVAYIILNVTMGSDAALG